MQNKYHIVTEDGRHHEIEAASLTIQAGVLHLWESEPESALNNGPVFKYPAAHVVTLESVIVEEQAHAVEHLEAGE